MPTGKSITDPIELMILAENKKCIMIQHSTVLNSHTPASVILNMPFRVVMKYIKDRKLYVYEKVSDNKPPHIKTNSSKVKYDVVDNKGIYIPMIDPFNKS